MSTRPNAIQKFVHRFFMLRPVTAIFAPWIHQLDTSILKWTKGKFTASEVVGWNIVQLTTTGARTGRARRMPLLALFVDEKIGLVASSFGRRHNPGWYYNLKSNPECEVQYRGRSRRYMAREAEGEERRELWQLALAYYAGYEKYQERASRKIPLMVLEPKQ